jgi:hypothetical protein
MRHKDMSCLGLEIIRKTFIMQEVKTDPLHVIKVHQNWAVAQCTIHASQIKTSEKLTRYIRFSIVCHFLTCCQIYHTLHMLLNHTNDLMCLQLVSSEIFIKIMFPAGLWPWGGLSLFNTLWMGDADLCSYIITVQGRLCKSAFLNHAWFPCTIHLIMPK